MQTTTANAIKVYVAVKADFAENGKMQVGQNSCGKRAAEFIRF